MTGRCNQPACGAAWGETCQDGNLRLEECPHWNQGASDEPLDAAATPTHDDSERVPWSGNSLGQLDEGLLFGGDTTLVGVLGSHDAGKTTLLLATYLSCLAGHLVAGAQFAGSRTLGAWEALAAWVRFEHPLQMLTFPPHTPRGPHRIPGLLHFALRERNRTPRHVLLADAPGEWFTNWAVNEHADNAEGARWVVERADAFLVLADSVRLSGEERGSARSQVRQLIERLAAHRRGRPVALVWAKADQTVPEPISDAVRRALHEFIPGAPEFTVTHKDPQGMCEPLNRLLFSAWSAPVARSLAVPVVHHDPFLAFRGTAA